MPLSLPNLDDLTWEDLLEEGRTLIPAWAPDWTNHNPSDPGITLIELFAYFSEKLMYRLNRVGDKNVEEFLKLMNGPGWKSQGPSFLGDEKRLSVRALRQPRRAVTAADFEDFTCAVPGVARAKCIPRRNLDSADPFTRTSDAPGHVSVVVLPKKGDHPSSELLASVRRELEPKRLLTTRVHAVVPQYLSVKCRLVVVAQRGVPAEGLRSAAMDRLNLFFDPLRGGLNGKGWPFGGSVYVSDLYRTLGDLGGVDRVMPIRDSAGKALDELVVEPGDSGRLRRNSRGEIEAVVLRPEELVQVRIERGDISLTPQV